VTPLELIYYAGYSLKKRCVLKEQHRLPHPVISVGNITIGGTGKTPATIAIAEEAISRGFAPVVLTRGYRGMSKGSCLVSDREMVLLSVEEAGDEPVVMAERLRGVPIVKSANRYEGGMFALQKLPHCPKPMLFILDDGFQHWALDRDVDVVLVDGMNPFGNRKLLPLGPLRGPLSELKEADIMVVTKTKNEALAEELYTINNNAPVFYSDYKVTGLRGKDGSQSDLSHLSNKKVYAFCGIANPESFRKTLQQSDCILLELKKFRDHHRYTQKEMDVIFKMAGELAVDLIITTEKDMVKTRDMKEIPQNIFSLEISFNIEKRFYNELFGRLKCKD
jgi:tetraacyldisaccharide 4'-kinase